MNRKNEYEAMIEELNQPAPGLETTLDRACQKKRKRTAPMIIRPIAGLAACFAVFVLLVNYSAAVAQACSQVPILRELAVAVTFSHSLSEAVENDYVQPMDLSQTENDITAGISYLIVDQKQVNVFYRLDSDKYTELYADPDVRSADGNRPVSCSYHNTGLDAENGELRCLSIDFMEDNVPSSLVIKLDVYANDIVSSEMAPSHSMEEDMFSDDLYEEPDYLANFEFLLEFDPKFTASGKVYPVNQTVILGGQTITITDIEVYPSHMRVDIAESPDNTAWLKGLDFYIETDSGMKFDPVSNGVTATRSGNSPYMISYRADSTYFYEAEHLRLVITGAEWLRKDMETTYLNLVTGEHGELPEGVAFEYSERTENGWIVTFRADWNEDEPMYQLFDSTFFDAEGNAYEICSWSSTFGDADEEGNVTYFLDKFPLENYPYDEVWLSPSPNYSQNWVSEDLIVITIQ